MIRILTLILVTLLAGAACAAPITPAASYFPLTAGATWTRKAEDGAQIIARVVGSKTVGSVRCTVIETKTVRGDRERAARNCYQATAGEILAIETVAGPRTIVLDPPRPLMKLPPAARKSWTWAPKNAPVEIKITDEWVREESVRVPAGVFRAWKLKSVTKREEFTVTILTWYAPGVGIVKIEREAVGGGQEREGGSELISYKIP